MYEFDFVSVVTGYIVGVLLCYSTTHIIFMDHNDEGE